ncbi:MAG: hypothetical protein AAF412_01850 [Pseudomonadota bacterium]
MRDLSNCDTIEAASTGAFLQIKKTTGKLLTHKNGRRSFEPRRQRLRRRSVYEELLGPRRSPSPWFGETYEEGVTSDDLAAPCAIGHDVLSISHIGIQTSCDLFLSLPGEMGYQ